MNKNFLMVLSLMLLALFVIGCSQQSVNTSIPASTASDNGNTQTNTQSNAPTNNIPSNGGQVTMNIQPPVGINTTSQSSVKEIDIEAYDYGFTQTGPAINKGDKVKIVFTVTNGDHSFILSGYSIEFPSMGPGQTQSASFIADKNGTFEYTCGNHPSMIGKLVVN